jgi:hypothetical protein
MTKACAQEFQTVDLIVNSLARTRGVDAFTPSLLKAEQQMRKLVTHLVYQFPCFGRADVPVLRQALADNTAVYFKGVEKGFNALYPKSIGDLVGSDYTNLKKRNQ